MYAYRDTCSHPCHHANLTMTHGQYRLLIGGSCDCFLYQQGVCSMDALQARMLRSEGVRMPGSKQAYLFRRFYRILYLYFSPFVGQRGLVYNCLLENCGVTAFILLCQLSHAWTISRQIIKSISSDRYHI